MKFNISNLLIAYCSIKITPIKKREEGNVIRAAFVIS